MEKKCCATCFYGELLTLNDEQRYCSGGGSRFADFVDKDSCCEYWAASRYDEEMRLLTRLYNIAVKENQSTNNPLA